MDTSSQNTLIAAGPSTQAPPTSSALPGGSQASKTGPEDFRLPWGKHKGKPLSEVPADYISWLKNSSDAYKTNKSMQEAVHWHLNSQPLQSSQQLSRSQSFSRLSSQVSQADQENIPPGSSLPVKQSAGGTYLLTFGKHAGKSLEDVPADYIAWLKTNDRFALDADLRAAIEAWDRIPRVYTLCFGKYKGCTLDQVPPTYLNYLHESDAADGHDDLRKALAEHKLANAATQRTKAAKKPFEVPSEYTSDFRRYYYGGTRKGGQMWIGVHDCVKCFGADPKAMTAAGMRVFNKGQRFWLHQVFAFAKHFGTTTGETPTKALNKFKARKYN